jgi:uncharacterized protein YkwD
MRVFSIIALIGLTACGGATIPIVAGPAPLAPLAPRQPNAIEDMSFATILNTYRASLGSNPVTYDARLNTAAQDFADVLAANPNHFSHTGPNGSTLDQRVRATGYVPQALAENIAGGQPTEQSIVDDWKASTGHNANMLNRTVDEFGLGLATTGAGQTRWVLVLANE